MSRPQVAALTNSEGLLPRWESHWPLLILSRMSASRVALSGMRSSASARQHQRHAFLGRQRNSCSKPCTRPARPALALRSRSDSNAQRQLLRRRGQLLRQAGLGQQQCQGLGLGAAVRGGDGRAQRLVSGVRGANWANSGGLRHGDALGGRWVPNRVWRNEAMIPGLEPNEYSKNALSFE